MSAPGGNSASKKRLSSGPHGGGVSSPNTGALAAKRARASGVGVEEDHTADQRLSLGSTPGGNKMNQSNLTANTADLQQVMAILGGMNGNGACNDDDDTIAMPDDADTIAMPAAAIAAMLPKGPGAGDEEEEGDEENVHPNANATASSRRQSVASVTDGKGGKPTPPSRRSSTSSTGSGAGGVLREQGAGRRETADAGDLDGFFAEIKEAEQSTTAEEDEAAAAVPEQHEAEMEGEEDEEEGMMLQQEDEMVVGGDRAGRRETADPESLRYLLTLLKSPGSGGAGRGSLSMSPAKAIEKVLTAATASAEVDPDATVALPPGMMAPDLTADDLQVGRLIEDLETSLLSAADSAVGGDATATIGSLFGSPGVVAAAAAAGGRPSLAGRLTADPALLESLIAELTGGAPPSMEERRASIDSLTVAIPSTKQSPAAAQEPGVDINRRATASPSDINALLGEIHGQEGETAATTTTAAAAAQQQQGQGQGQTFSMSPPPLPVQGSSRKALRSCLSSKKARTPAPPQVQTSPVPGSATKKSVVFGSPQGAFFHKHSPSNSLTPMTKVDVERNFPSVRGAAPGEREEDEEETGVTAQNSAILAQWNNDQDEDEEEEEEEDEAAAAARVPSSSAGKRRRGSKSPRPKRRQSLMLPAGSPGGFMGYNGGQEEEDEEEGADSSGSSSGSDMSPDSIAGRSLDGRLDQAADEEELEEEEAPAMMDASPAPSAASQRRRRSSLASASSHEQDMPDLDDRASSPEGFRAVDQRTSHQLGIIGGPAAGAGGEHTASLLDQSVGGTDMGEEEEEDNERTVELEQDLQSMVAMTAMAAAQQHVKKQQPAPKAPVAAKPPVAAAVDEDRTVELEADLGGLLAHVDGKAAPAPAASDEEEEMEKDEEQQKAAAAAAAAAARRAGVTVDLGNSSDEEEEQAGEGGENVTEDMTDIRLSLGSQDDSAVFDPDVTCHSVMSSSVAAGAGAGAAGAAGQRKFSLSLGGNQEEESMEEGAAAAGSAQKAARFSNASPSVAAAGSKPATPASAASSASSRRRSSSAGGDTTASPFAHIVVGGRLRVAAAAATATGEGDESHSVPMTLSASSVAEPSVAAASPPPAGSASKKKQPTPASAGRRRSSTGSAFGARRASTASVRASTASVQAAPVPVAMEVEEEDDGVPVPFDWLRVRAFQRDEEGRLARLVRSAALLEHEPEEEAGADAKVVTLAALQQAAREALLENCERVAANLVLLAEEDGEGASAAQQQPLVPGVDVPLPDMASVKRALLELDGSLGTEAVAGLVARAAPTLEREWAALEGQLLQMVRLRVGGEVQALQERSPDVEGDLARVAALGEEVAQALACIKAQRRELRRERRAARRAAEQAALRAQLAEVEGEVGAAKAKVEGLEAALGEAEEAAGLQAAERDARRRVRAAGAEKAGVARGVQALEEQGRILRGLHLWQPRALTEAEVLLACPHPDGSHTELRLVLGAGGNTVTEAHVTNRLAQPGAGRRGRGGKDAACGSKARALLLHLLRALPVFPQCTEEAPATADPAAEEQQQYWSWEGLAVPLSEVAPALARLERLCGRVNLLVESVARVEAAHPCALVLGEAAVRKEGAWVEEALYGAGDCTTCPFGHGGGSGKGKGAAEGVVVPSAAAGPLLPHCSAVLVVTLQQAATAGGRRSLVGAAGKVQAKFLLSVAFLSSVPVKVEGPGAAAFASGKASALKDLEGVLNHRMGMSAVAPASTAAGKKGGAAVVAAARPEGWRLTEMLVDACRCIKEAAGK